MLSDELLYNSFSTCELSDFYIYDKDEPPTLFSNQRIGSSEKHPWIKS